MTAAFSSRRPALELRGLEALALEATDELGSKVLAVGGGTAIAAGHDPASVGECGRNSFDPARNFRQPVQGSVFCLCAGFELGANAMFEKLGIAHLVYPRTIEVVRSGKRSAVARVGHEAKFPEKGWPDSRDNDDD